MTFHPFTGGTGGDPHFSIALHDGKMLCYSVQGRPDSVFNLISCDNFLINAQFIPDSKRKGVTWMGAVGVVLKRALKFEGSRVTHFLFDAQSYTFHIGNKISVAANTIQELISVNGTLSVVRRHGPVSPSSQPVMRISLKEEGLEFTIKFEGQHLDLFWHRAVKSKNSHGLIGKAVNTETCTVGQYYSVTESLCVSLSCVSTPPPPPPPPLPCLKTHYK